ncbi:MAG: metallophosphoesterase, partial [Bacteroidales bacterium]|nr:metallophosphoesterase [Bacteroidales bacterium]
MKIIEYPEVKQVVVSGDIHGDFKTLVYKLCLQYGYTDTLLIVAGDCGFGFEKPGYYETIYNHVAGRLKKANNWVVFIRGNHDDPSYFAEEKIHYARWRCVPDYSVIRAAGHNILCVGGAVSIDRKMRKRQNIDRLAFGHTETASWWADEAPVFNQEEIDAIPKDILIDTVVTHTSPSYCELITKDGLKDWLIYDPGLKWDTQKERETMDQLATALQGHHPVKQWFYGHFHRTWSGVRQGIRYSMLDIMEFRSLIGKQSEELEDVIPLHNRGGEENYLKRIEGNT